MSKNNISDDDIYENKTELKDTGAYSIDASAGTDLRIARDTFCFQGLSLRMPMPKPERKNSSPVVTRSHFCEASNSSTAESQMKACSLLLGGGKGRKGRMGFGGVWCNSTVSNNTRHSPSHLCSTHLCVSLKVTRTTNRHLIGKGNPMPDQWTFVPHWIPSETILLET